MQPIYGEKGSGERGRKGTGRYPNLRHAEWRSVEVKNWEEESTKLLIPHFDKIKKKVCLCPLVRVSRTDIHISRKQNMNSVTLQHRLLACSWLILTSFNWRILLSWHSFSLLFPKYCIKACITASFKRIKTPWTPSRTLFKFSLLYTQAANVTIATLGFVITGHYTDPSDLYHAAFVTAWQNYIIFFSWTTLPKSSNNLLLRVAYIHSFLEF